MMRFCKSQREVISLGNSWQYSQNIKSRERTIRKSNDNRTEWSPIRSVIMRVITKSNILAAGVRFVYHEYDYRPNWMTLDLKKVAKFMKEGKVRIKILAKEM